MSRPDGYKFLKSHEWARIDGEFAWIGITDYAVKHLSDLVFLDLRLHTLTGWNHCVARQPGEDYQPIADMIGEACAFLTAAPTSETAGATTA
jgi:hypothetical protein